MNGNRSKVARIEIANIRNTDCQGILERSATAIGGPII
jgi:hypothetical protein